MVEIPKTNLIITHNSDASRHVLRIVHGLPGLEIRANYKFSVGKSRFMLVPGAVLREEKERVAGYRFNKTIIVYDTSISSYIEAFLKSRSYDEEPKFIFTSSDTYLALLIARTIIEDLVGDNLEQSRETSSEKTGNQSS